jgi:hypothetical protein
MPFIVRNRRHDRRHQHRFGPLSPPASHVAFSRSADDDD